LDVDDAANRNVVPLRRISEKHCETAREHNERFLLRGVDVTPTPRARLVSPDVRAAVLEAEPRLELSDMSGRLTRLVRARGPLKLF
jgi:hypothetical protein